MKVVLRNIAPHLLSGRVVIDVACVKEEPPLLMQQILPQHVQLIAPHPLFCPQGAANGLEGRRIA
ncbi:prephenate dehydrogenase/arogenate dehydrogenase family protein [Paracoccus sp. (in: a-proteobacteria)]|uniref:prephenate dehydrogenase/arogenate dehydrogenase family protein n=1 Tax=Paracoccus sp. TaxID=267 RepID=UPI00396CAAA4